MWRYGARKPLGERFSDAMQKDLRSVQSIKSEKLLSELVKRSMQIISQVEEAQILLAKVIRRRL